MTAASPRTSGDDPPSTACGASAASRSNYGVTLQGVDPPGDFTAMVAEIESLDFGHLWVTDSSLHARNSYVYLTLAALNSSRLRLGTAVTNPVTRHPAITAAAAATLDEVSGGRAILGIGAGDRPLLALGRRPCSPADLAAAIEAIRALWSGDEVTLTARGFALDHARLRFGARAGLPIFVSASGPKTLELAGGLADGVILLVGLFPDAVTWALEHIDRGARAAGRPRPHTALFAYGAISDDGNAALAAGRSIAAWFPQTAPHLCELAGLPADVAAAVRTSYAGGEFQEAGSAARLLPDSFVRRMALAGDAQEASERIGDVLRAGVDSVHVFPLGPDRMATIRAFADLMKALTHQKEGSGASAPRTT
ncbi:MAG TPA: LLM class flavin-dependent oxidoreductase [Streptosporangiaceae bacterium]|nr:LLM class flavin-dependent oxidoreductase [Streptosporangiaceae bacterium]